MKPTEGSPYACAHGHVFYGHSSSSSGSYVKQHVLLSEDLQHNPWLVYKFSKGVHIHVGIGQSKGVDDTQQRYSK